MKKIYLILSLICAITLIACEDFTDIEPRDSFTDLSYWRTTQDLKLYMNGFYRDLNAPSVAYDNDQKSDDMVTGSPSGWLFNTLSTQQAIDNNTWNWNNIRNLNYFLNRYQTVTGSESEINQYVGEARFFRSLDYFKKIKTFGDVPWYDKDLKTTDREELFKARDSRDDILNHIIEDLEFAIQWLPATGASGYEKGRLNKEAAQAQLARVCLHYGTYKKYHNVQGSPSSNELLKKAADISSNIIASGKFEAVQGTDAGCGQSHRIDDDGTEYPLHYGNLFTQYDLSNNKEAILARFYIKDGVDVYHETGRQEGSSGGFSKNFVESFLMKDGTPIYNTGSGYHGDDSPDEEFKDRDPRIYQIVASSYRPVRVNNGIKTYQLGGITPNGGVTGYSPIKFLSADENQANALATDYDWFVYRYGEVLLINAEANCELGTCTQAVLDNTINKLRDRVEMAHLSVTPTADQHKTMDYGYNVSDLLYEIRRERRIELAHEGFRYDDLMRWNAFKLLENPRTMFGLKVTDKVKTLYNPGYYGQNGIDNAVYFTKLGDTKKGTDDRMYVEAPNPQGGTSFYLFRYAEETNAKLTPTGEVAAGRKWSANDKRFFYPIPTEQITINPNLLQNPGWD